MDAHGMSERRARRLIEADRKTVRYRSRRRRDDALRGRLRELAAEQRRFGYRRLHVLLRVEGCIVSRKKTQTALSRGRPDRSQAQRPQAGDRHAGADPGRGEA
jgi:hypothetical protein